MAQAESIADQIAFQVNEAYRGGRHGLGRHRRRATSRGSGERELPTRAIAACAREPRRQRRSPTRRPH